MTSRATLVAVSHVGLVLKQACIWVLIPALEASVTEADRAMGLGTEIDMRTQHRCGRLLHIATSLRQHSVLDTIWQ